MMKKTKTVVLGSSSKINLSTRDTPHNQPNKNQNNHSLNNSTSFVSVERVTNKPLIVNTETGNRTGRTNRSDNKVYKENKKTSVASLTSKSKVEKSYSSIRNERLKRATIDLSKREELYEVFNITCQLEPEYNNTMQIVEEESNIKDFTRFDLEQLRSQGSQEFEDYDYGEQLNLNNKNKIMIESMIGQMLDSILGEYEWKQMQQCNNRLRMQVQQVTKDKESMIKHCETIIKEHVFLQRKCQSLEKKYEKCKQQLQIQGSTILEQENTIQSLHAQLAAEKYKIQDLLANNKKISAESIIFQRQNQTFKKELLNLKKELGVLKKENIGLKKTLQQLQSIQATQPIDAPEYQKIIACLQAELTLQRQNLKKYEQENFHSEILKTLESLRLQNFSLLKTYNSLELKSNFQERKHIQQRQRLKQQYQKELKQLRENNRKLLKSNLLLKRAVDQNKGDSIEFILQDNPL